MPTSTELAADRALIAVWDPAVPFPSPREMPDLDRVTQVVVTRAEPGAYHYLHEATIAWHRGRFYLGWANHRTGETGDHDELIRGCSSPDGLHWSPPETWAQPPLAGATSLNHPLLWSHDETLYGWFVCWREGHRPTTELFIRDDRSGVWVWQEQAAIPLFVPFCPPQRTAQGDWLLGGERWWYDAAVALSAGDDLTRWRLVTLPRPDELRLLYPEAAIVDRGDNHWLAVCRPQQHTPGVPDAWTAPVASSADGGQTWTPLGLSNFPLAPSQPFAGRLSTGQQYLLTNSLEEGRCLLTIAVTGPSGGLFRRIYKVRHQAWPAVRLFGGWGDGSRVGQPTEWSYPNALEHEGHLYIACTQGKEDCVLSIVPLEVLAG
ncbi:MAG: exo-alpha-sialidase [Fimbriimonadaceae bacterium]|nr:exo-alpha-sialidase [Fimbriimonadaceae bacterium]